MMRLPKVQRRRTLTGRQSGVYYFRFVDPGGRRRWVSCRTGDKRAAEKIRDAYIERTLAVARGDINPDAERLIEEARKPVRTHVHDYIGRCLDNGQDTKSVREKERHLAWFLDICESFKPPWRLDGIHSDIIDERLGALTADGKSARSVNIKLEAMRAFLRWCVQHGRLDRDVLRVLKKRNEVTDRRLIHRVLTESETNSLLAVARKAESHGSRGRWLWYALPLYAALRRGDLVRLAWRDLDLVGGTVTFRGGKARHRVDRLPLLRELQDALERLKPANVLPSARVFPRPVSNATRQMDYRRAGIVLNNEYGTADLHSLRATFATRLAIRGIAPAALQRLMRHSTPTLTMKYYVHLEVDSLRSALEGHARVAATL